VGISDCKKLCVYRSYCLGLIDAMKEERKKEELIYFNIIHRNTIRYLDIATKENLCI